MDISSLLSPQESPRGTPLPQPPPSSRPAAKKHRGTKTAKPNAQTTISPRSKSSLPPSALTSNAVFQPHQPVATSPPLVHPTSAMRIAPENTPDSGRLARQGSTPGMDTLADLASMQLHQQTNRAGAGGLRSSDIYDNQTSANSTILPTVHGMQGPLPGRRSLDHTATDASSGLAPTRTFTTEALSESELQEVTQLVTYLSANQFAYQSHVQLIDLLHRGFRSHVQLNSLSAADAGLQTYNLLPDLRSARDSMDARFAIGERLWVDRIEDEALLATTFDESIAVLELCVKAVQEEAGSTKLWALYAKWMTSMYVAAKSDHAAQEAVQVSRDIQSWSDEDKVVGEEVCSWQQMIDIWARGVRATNWRLDESHVLWDPYTELLLLDLARSCSPDGVLAMKAHFLDRLQTPHSTWDTTFQMFSNFISHYENQSYEDIMTTVNQQCSNIKAIYSERETLEFAVRKADEINDNAAQMSAFRDYIDWEITGKRRKHAFAFELGDALYQRAVLSCPADTELWEGYVVFLNEGIVSQSRQDVDLLPVLDRSTRHCPWSGSLWSQYLLAAERQKMPFADIGQIKHKATSTGLLDAGGLEEVLQVYVAWCSILRRRAFQKESTDEELDVAEVGILSAIEDMQRLGETKYGKDYQGDPNYRLERIYIKYLTQSRNWYGVRKCWKKLIPSRGNSYEFWLRYYLSEMSAWGKISYSENTTNAPSSPRPSEATKVLRTALKTPNIEKLDWPERIIQLLQDHCEDHEDAAELQSASVQVWKARKVVRRRREKEAIEAYEAAQAQALQEAHTLKPEISADSAISFASSKRKRDDESSGPGGEGTLKKSRGNDEAGGADTEELHSILPSELKRDRENTTVVVKNLPKDATETRVRQFFRKCGSINSLKLLLEEHSDSATATIEFETRSDSLAAQTQDKKDFDGQEIEVQIGSGSTVWVTNFPPTADELWVREKFGAYGEIIDVRFPSLQGNTHRRFCYVQFKTADQATSATELDGQTFGSKLKLVARISDPSRRQNRVGALDEGREIHVRNLDWAVTETELEALFSKYGDVEQTRIPRDFSGKSKGFAFVVLSTKEEANAALDLNNTKLKSRIMAVMLASKTPANRRATTIIQSGRRSSTSPSPDIKMANGDQPAGASPALSAGDDSKPDSAQIQARTVSLLNVPDTVNDARIRALAEPYGPLVKVVLRPDHQGAILEYRDIADAGKAALGIEGYEIAPGRLLGIGTVREMFNQKAGKRNDKLGSNAGKKKEASAVLQSSMAIRRPAQAGGRRGGLGVKRGGTASAGGAKPQSNNHTMNSDVNDTSSTREEGGKSNADFKAMIFTLPIPIATLALQPQKNGLEVRAGAKLSGTAGGDGRIGLDAPPAPPLTDWCRPPGSDLDLHFSTRSAKPLPHNDVLWVVGVLREVAADETQARGEHARIGNKALTVQVRNIVITIFDERLRDRTWAEIHYALDMLLLCIFQKKVASEFHATFFEVATWKRLASVMIVAAQQSGELGGANVTMS
ncbi:MAG: hypothetical protein Q9216_002535 [Gyalolechia sp. 2 TL-2023]